MLDPRKLDVAPWAKSGQALHGAWPAQEFERLGADALPVAQWPAPQQVQWQAQGAEHRHADGRIEVGMHLRANVVLALTCQRCLQPLTVPLEVDRHFVFAADEAQAAEMDEELDEADVLPLSRALDLRGLVEDELILATPLVPRHADCRLPLVEAGAEVVEPQIEAPPHPFAALAALKKGKPGG